MFANLLSREFPVLYHKKEKSSCFLLVKNTYNLFRKRKRKHFRKSSIGERDSNNQSADETGIVRTRVVHHIATSFLDAHQGRIQDFHLGGRGAKDYVRARTS